MTKQLFSELGLSETLQRALTEREHTTPTPIQAQAIPEVMAGRDVLAIAQTGTGKTAAFALPILHRLAGANDTARGRTPRALVLAPTRELAIQIADEFRAYGAHLRLRLAVVYGGVGQKPQVDALARGVDILVATPGRLLDLMGQRRVNLHRVEHLVLDEADRMLDMGFVRDVRRILVALPAARQSLLFSATMPRDVARLASDFLRDPVRVAVAPQATPVERIRQSVFHVSSGDKQRLLAEILDDPALSRVLVFARTKHRANRVAILLEKGGVAAEAMHGNKSQGARQRALERFRRGEARVLVATDIAARGIDVDDISHVINFELPNVPESYVHRIGRTARAGADGIAYSFCDADERESLGQIESLIRQRLTVIGDAPAPVPYRPARARPRGKGAGSGRRRGAPSFAKASPVTNPRFVRLR